MSFLDRVADQVNLRWAWDKVRNAATPGDIWIDELDLSAFELNLDRNLGSIAHDIRKGRYRLGAMRPMAFPKNPRSDGTPQLRQYFHFRIRDQVAWVAVVNQLAQFVDKGMPTWSYGNRLFKSIWVETDNAGNQRRKIGRYRHSSGQIYLPFRQGWPIFKRHIYLSIRAMTGEGREDELSIEDRDELRFQEDLAVSQKCPFVLPEYWQTRRAEKRDEIYWCSIDLEKFYPSLRLATVRKNILSRLTADDFAEADRLISSMLHFTVDTDGWTDAELKKIGLRGRMKTFGRVPTGLFVAGFLANAGLLEVDSEVERRLAARKIAHFRYVDDHVVLAYTFEDLKSWIDEYCELLREDASGAHLNPEKIEPIELAKLLRRKAGSDANGPSDAIYASAKKACMLDPKFPSPLMTKTLGLVSTIGRTDFNLLEESELATLVNQLEHLLLVDISEKEIPERTRLSFAATRLARLAEQRLANDTELLFLEGQLRAARSAEAGDRSAEMVESDLRSVQNKLSADSNRIFSLLQKVLRDRPDRVRLWTRAIQLCRQTGVRRLREVFSDVESLSTAGENALAADYLLANVLSLLGTNAIVAARVLVDAESAEWRKRAAREFLSDVTENVVARLQVENAAWYVRRSWWQYCFGLFCAELILRVQDVPVREPTIPADLFNAAMNLLTQEGAVDSPAAFAWWATRMSLADMDSHPAAWVRFLGEAIPESRESLELWRFFPSDIPLRFLSAMLARKSVSSGDEGWWYEALSSLNPEVAGKISTMHARPLRRVAALIQREKSTSTVSLAEWVLFTEETFTRDQSDPRVGEWTALEVVRQIAISLSKASMLNAEMFEQISSGVSPELRIHPANYLVPRKWVESKSLRWDEWRDVARRGPIERVPLASEILDVRYTPMLTSRFFDVINPLRGLGLILCGLLRHSFKFPAAWNGAGHSDVLRSLPRLLMKNLTYSSHTLGVLQGCLQARALENLSLDPVLDLVLLNEDTEHDPFRFRDLRHLAETIGLCQHALQSAQMSTFESRTRQLTPISVRALTEPIWKDTYASAIPSLDGAEG